MRSRREKLIVGGGAVLLAILALVGPLLLSPGRTPATPATSSGEPVAALATAPGATDTPTSIPETPTPTPFAFPARSRIANVDVGGLSLEDAEERVQAALDKQKREIVLETEGFSTTL